MSDAKRFECTYHIEANNTAELAVSIDIMLMSLSDLGTEEYAEVVAILASGAALQMATHIDGCKDITEAADVAFNHIGEIVLSCIDDFFRNARETGKMEDFNSMYASKRAKVGQ